MVDRCVMCGEIIPEGRQICPLCEQGKTPKMANKKRLIDANALKRQFVDYVRTPPHFHYGDWQNMCINGTEIDEVIENTPTVDAVEVVRCKDCKHSKDINIMGGTYQKHCKLSYGLPCVEPNDFCSYGERREECSQ